MSALTPNPELEQAVQKYCYFNLSTNSNLVVSFFIANEGLSLITLLKEYDNGNQSYLGQIRIGDVNRHGIFGGILDTTLKPLGQIFHQYWETKQDWTGSIEVKVPALSPLEKIRILAS